MRKKINRYFLMIAIFSILCMMLVMTLIFYSQLKKQVFFDVLVSTFPAILAMAVLLIVVSLFVSRYLTDAILRPIENMTGDAEQLKEDMTYPELVPFTNKIREQHEEILSSVNIRQEFTANVTHELKTPLAAISGYAELMESGLANEKDIQHFSGEIRKSAARLLTLINDIINLSKLDEGNSKECLEITNIAEIAIESVEMLSINAAKNYVDIQYKGEKEAFVRIGNELAQELIYNLVENAVRYNRPGGTVRVRVESNPTDIVLCVEDSGIGIPSEHHERIFERFYRVDKSRSKELGGTGLGLAIVKHICTMTDGELHLKSQPGVGTQMKISWKKE